MKINILTNFKATKLNIIKNQLMSDLGNKVNYSKNFDTWFYYEFYTQYIWNPLPKDKLIGIIQDKYIVPNITYLEKSNIKSLTNYSLAKEIEKELRLKYNGFEENNDLFIGNNKLYSFVNNQIQDIPQNIKELNIVNYIPYSLDYKKIELNEKKN